MSNPWALPRVTTRIIAAGNALGVPVITATQTLSSMTERDLPSRAEVEALGVQCLAADLDVSADESCDAFCRSVDERFGRVDILAHAAGITAEAKLTIPLCAL